MEAIQDLIISQEAQLKTMRELPIYPIWFDGRWADVVLAENVLAFGVEYTRLEKSVHGLIVEQAALQTAQLVAGAGAQAARLAGTVRVESVRESKDRLIGHLPSYMPDHKWVDPKTGKENRSARSQARRGLEIALPFAKAQDVLPASDSALLAGLGAKDAELRERVEKAIAFIDEGMALILLHSVDLNLVLESNWDAVDSFRSRHDTLSPKLAEDWGKHVSKRAKVEEDRAREDRVASMSGRGPGRGRGGDFYQGARDQWVHQQGQQGFQWGGRGSSIPYPPFQQGRGRGRGF
jgi:hypothetical protein